MLGVDAGDLSFIQAHQSQLPVFRRLLHGGVLRRLDTSSKLLTGSVWPTFYTGMHPGEHGVYHHLQWDPDRMQTRRVSADWLYQEPFWYKLARNGVRVTVADVPMMFPAASAGHQGGQLGFPRSAWPLSLQPAGDGVGYT